MIMHPNCSRIVKTDCPLKRANRGVIKNNYEKKLSEKTNEISENKQQHHKSNPMAELICSAFD